MSLARMEIEEVELLLLCAVVETTVRLLSEC